MPFKRNDHPGSAVGSRRVRASGNAAAQRAAIAQNPCAPKRSTIGPQASVSRAVATDADGTVDSQCRRLEEAKFAADSPLE